MKELSTIPVKFAVTRDRESDEVLLLQTSPRLCPKLSITLDTVSVMDSFAGQLGLDAWVLTTDAD